MTSHAARLYALVAAVLVFFVAWAAIAAHPWQTQQAVKQDPRLVALQLREQRLRADARAVQRVLDRRWAAYRAQLAVRKRQIVAVKAAQARTQAAALASAAAASTPAAYSAPPVRVVTLPPVTITRTS